MAILTTSDFTGKYLIHTTNASATLLTDIITDAEQTYLRRLLGDDLYTQFIAGLAEVSPLSKWTDLRDGKTYTVADASDEKGVGTISHVFRGVKKMLKSFVLYEWNNQTRYAKSTTGIIAPQHELGNQLSPDAFQDVQINLINEGVDIFNEAIEFIDEMNDATENTYPNFEPTLLPKRLTGIGL